MTNRRRILLAQLETFRRLAGEKERALIPSNTQRFLMTTSALARLVNKLDRIPAPRLRPTLNYSDAHGDCYGDRPRKI